METLDLTPLPGGAALRLRPAGHRRRPGENRGRRNRDRGRGASRARGAGRGLRIREPRITSLARLGSGYQVVTRERYAPWIESFLAGRRKARLSRAALETVAVVASPPADHAGRHRAHSRCGHRRGAHHAAQARPHPDQGAGSGPGRPLLTARPRGSSTISACPGSPTCRASTKSRRWRRRKPRRCGATTRSRGSRSMEWTPPRCPSPTWNRRGRMRPSRSASSATRSWPSLQDVVTSFSVHALDEPGAAADLVDAGTELDSPVQQPP